MAERLIRLHQDGGVQYENHLNDGEEVITYTDDDGNIDLYVRGSGDSDVVLTGPLAAELNAVPEPEEVTEEELDEDEAEAEESGYADWTKAELQDELRDLGLPTSGNKDELIERLVQA